MFKYEKKPYICPLIMRFDSFIKGMPQDEERFFHELFMEYYPALLSFARHYVEEGATAEDLVQDVFVKVWETRGRWEGVEDFSAYLYQMVRYRCFNHLRGEKVRLDAMAAYRKELSDTAEINRYIEEETFRLVYRAMEELPPACRKVFELVLDGLRAKDIARELGIAEETVKKQKQVARRILKEKLGNLYLFLSPLMVC